MYSNEKIDAIYDLRAAVETKMKAERMLDATPSQDTRAALLDATLDVEAKTLNAIEICHECGHGHAPEAGHGPDAGGSNVISVDFGREDAREPFGDA